MDRRYSPITDLYGTAPQDPPPRRRRHTVLYLLLALAGFFIIESMKPVMRLRPNPPPLVMSNRLSAGAPPNQLELQVVRECWAFAVASVQKQYPFGSTLPKEPPASAQSRTLKPTALRELCWPRLRNAWSHPDSWKRSYEWSTDWLTNPKSSFRQNVDKVVSELGDNL